MALSKSTFLVGSIIGLLIGAVLGYTLAFSRLDGLESRISMLKEQVTDLESQLVGNLTLISQLQTVVIALVQGTQTSGQGTISGKVTIGPLCPVEPCPDPIPDIYTSRQLILQPLVLQPDSGNPMYIQLNPDGSFQATVNAGIYTVNLTNCTFLGCKYILPKIVAVRPNETTTVNIDIDTGIR
jgi:hypothetical protein